VKKFLFALAAATVAAFSMSAAAEAGESKMYVGPAVYNFGGIGAIGKFGVADNISVRPFGYFSSTLGVNYTAYGATATYDYKIPASDFTVYGGAGFAGFSASANGTTIAGIANGVTFTLGADYQINDTFVVNANTNALGVNVGLGYNF
jgi:hypothetical protein